MYSVSVHQAVHQMQGYGHNCTLCPRSLFIPGAELIQSTNYADIITPFRMWAIAAAMRCIKMQLHSFKEMRAPTPNAFSLYVQELQRPKSIQPHFRSRGNSNIYTWPAWLSSTALALPRWRTGGSAFLFHIRPVASSTYSSNLRPLLQKSCLQVIRELHSSNITAV